MSALLPVRVTLPEVWNEVTLQLAPESSVAQLKQLALTHEKVRRNPAEYLVKFRGAELEDESRTLASWGVVANSPLIVLSRRRRPTR